MLHKIVKEYMREQGVRQSWLAGRLGIKESKLSEILNGKRPFNSDLFAKICIELGVSADYFVGKLTD